MVPSPLIQLVLADVDGTLVTPEKLLTVEAIDAVRLLRAAGIRFAITSGRPPRGMAMLVEPLAIETPIAAFNGGLLVDREMKVLVQHVVAPHLVDPIGDQLSSHGLGVWIYRGADWYVPDREGPHVEREAWTVKFDPKVMRSRDGLTDGVVKIVGVSDDSEAVSTAWEAVQDEFGDHVTVATSQPYYLDVTHPQANKGWVVQHLAGKYKLSADEIATIGDMPNDVLMFAHSGLGIAMGNADPQVKRAARRVTDSNEHEGFARAIRRFVLETQSSTRVGPSDPSTGTGPDAGGRAVDR